ncbi:MAG: hypothetical protein QOJ57_1405, partial [Thermoleophilaceae bacterium]|nr:hypothetical protein [Thermoleophilaceae bacterium]
GEIGRFLDECWSATAASSPKRGRRAASA